MSQTGCYRFNETAAIWTEFEFLWINDFAISLKLSISAFAMK
jgi:hypothetical protein